MIICACTPAYVNRYRGVGGRARAQACKLCARAGSGARARACPPAWKTYGVHGNCAWHGNSGDRLGQASVQAGSGWLSDARTEGAGTCP